MSERSAPLVVKLAFWLVLGVLSVFFAEVVSTSTPFPVLQPFKPFVNVWGIFVVFPLYTLHVLVLSSLIFRKGRISFTTLFLAGAILGLYEAYITKVIWNPTWGNSHVYFGGIAVVQTAVLVLFWHPMMAFVMPVLVGENLFASSRETFDALATRIKTMLSTLPGAVRGAVVVALLCGIYEGSGAKLAFVSAVGAVAGLFAVGAVWKRVCAGRDFGFRELLPSRRQNIVLGALLALVYILNILFVRTGAMPRTLLPHVTVWTMYAILFTLLHFSLKRAAIAASAAVRDESAAESVVRRSPLRAYACTIGLVMTVVFPTAAAIASTDRTAAWIGAFLILGCGCGFGVALIGAAVVASVRDRLRSQPG
jgi:energy-converting hydrogenase Eha subunit A